MKVLVILNGISRKRGSFLRNIRPYLQADVVETEYAGHAEKIDCTGYDVVIVAGGDGTMSQVVNNVMRLKEPPTLGLIPLGSGNDLARAFDLKTESIFPLLKNNQPKLVDVGEVTLNGITRYFINECSIGMGPEVVKKLESSRNPGASINYLKAIITTFFTHKPQKIHVKANNFEWEGNARVLAVANGKAFGHSIYIAPDAKIDDGKLNMFMCKGIPLVKFLLYLQAIKTPKKINDPKWLEYRLTNFIEINSETPLPVEADGELIGFTPLTCGVAQKKIKVLA